MKLNTKKIALSGLMISVAILLPFLTGQIPQIGSMLTPMHFPVLISSILVGPVYGLIVGFLAPLLRQLLFGMPPFPMSFMMALELAVYGITFGAVFKKAEQILPNQITRLIVSLIISMILGRLMFTLTALTLTGAQSFTAVFFGLFITSLPGILLQLLIIPLLYIRLKDKI